MFVLKNDTERNFIGCNETSSAKSKRLEDRMPPLFFETQRNWVPKSVDLLQWCSCWVAASEGVLKADADGGGYLQLNEGKKCCISAVGTHTVCIRVEQAPQTHARGWERKDHSCLPLSQETWIGPQRTLRQLQENCGPQETPRHQQQRQTAFARSNLVGRALARTGRNNNRNRKGADERNHQKKNSGQAELQLLSWSIWGVEERFSLLLSMETYFFLEKRTLFIF